MVYCVRCPNYTIPVFDELLVHFSDVAKVSLVTTNNIRMPKVGVGSEEDFHSALPPSFLMMGVTPFHGSLRGLDLCPQIKFKLYYTAKTAHNKARYYYGGTF